MNELRGGELGGFGAAVIPCGGDGRSVAGECLDHREVRPGFQRTRHERAAKVMRCARGDGAAPGAALQPLHERVRRHAGAGRDGPVGTRCEQGANLAAVDRVSREALELLV